jgi:hypothetical protein
VIAPEPVDHRAPIAVRIFIGLLGGAALLFNMALMVSDRAPGVTRRLFGGFAQRLADQLNKADVVDRGRLPGNDAIVHIGVWGFATVLVALTLWRWSALIPVAIGVFALGAAVEFGQGRYSSTREVEFSDLLANGVGVGVGVGAAAICMLGWSAVSRFVRGNRPPRR